MKKHARVGLLGVPIVVALVAWGATACRGEIVVAQENGVGGDAASDSGGATCGATTCGDGELCCAGPDEACSPTCMKVTVCPRYGRPCRIDGGSADAASSDAPSLAWYATCASPVCPAPDASGTPPVCAKQGTPCTVKGATCGDGSTTCGSVMLCDDHDPRSGGCPISSAKFKSDVHYLGDPELKTLHDEAMRVRLATYRYKGPWATERNATHLGFVIEDQPDSLSVERGQDRVDMYGYLSMVVGAMQVQEKEIAALKRELREVRQTCGDPRGAR